MNNLKLASLTLLALLSLLVLHIYGMSRHLYLNIWYYDVIMHLLGGVGIALATLYVLKNPKYIIIATFVMGIVWELFEVYFNLTGYVVGTMPYTIDTTKDLIMDTLGAFFVWYVVRRDKRNTIEK